MTVSKGRIVCSMTITVLIGLAFSQEAYSRNETGYPPIASEVIGASKTIHFPPQRRSHTKQDEDPVIVWSADFLEHLDKPKNARSIKSATGNVSLPAKQLICLGMELPEAATHLMMLGRLEPRDIQGLYLYAESGISQGQATVFDDALHQARHLEDLQYLFISGHVSKPGIDNLLKFPHLKSLSIERPDLGVSDLVCLKQLKGTADCQIARHPRCRKGY